MEELINSKSYVKYLKVYSDEVFVFKFIIKKFKRKLIKLELWLDLEWKILKIICKIYNNCCEYGC